MSREISKVHETTVRDTLDGLVSFFTANAPKGEIVVVVAGAGMDEDETDDVME